MSDPASRDDVRRLEERLGMIDQMGTRGVAVLAVQVQEIAKDVARLDSALAEHGKAHERETASRLSSRRWLIGIAIAVIAAIDGPIVTVLFHMH